MKLIFIHGAGGSPMEWAYQTQHFATSEAVVLPGHPEGTPCSTLDEYAVWLHDYIHRCGYQNVILAGHSMGGAIAQLYALKYDGDLKALILVGTGARLRVSTAILSSLQAMTTNTDAWQKYLADDIYRQVDPEMKSAVMATRLRIGAAVMVSDLLACNKFDIMDRVQDIKLPTLIIGGSEDSWTPVKYSHYLATKILGSTEAIIPGGGHWSFLEKPQEVNQAIDNFLTRTG